MAAKEPARKDCLQQEEHVPSEKSGVYIDPWAADVSDRIATLILSALT
jgi:hypothetical protein